MKTSRRNNIIWLLVFLFVTIVALPGAGHAFSDQQCKNDCADKYIDMPNGIMKWHRVGMCELYCTIF